MTHGFKGGQGRSSQEIKESTRGIVIWFTVLIILVAVLVLTRGGSQ